MDPGTCRAIIVVGIPDNQMVVDGRQHKRDDTSCCFFGSFCL